MSQSEEGDNCGSAEIHTGRCRHGRREFGCRRCHDRSEPTVRTGAYCAGAYGAEREVGADVPYCLLRGTALAEGIGEKLRALPPCPDCYVLIGKPPVSVSTKFVYEKLDASEIVQHPEIDRMLEGLQWHNLNRIAEHMGNVLESVTIPAYPVIEEIKQHMKDHGAVNA